MKMHLIAERFTARLAGLFAAAIRFVIFCV